MILLYYQTVYQSFTSVYPWPLGLILYFIYRNRVIKTLKVKEIWSLTYEQVFYLNYENKISNILFQALNKFETTVKALSDKMQQNNSNYLLGEKYVLN